jgi:hypothetical protein
LSLRGHASSRTLGQSQPFPGGEVVLFDDLEPSGAVIGAAPLHIESARRSSSLRPRRGRSWPGVSIAADAVLAWDRLVPRRIATTHVSPLQQGRRAHRRPARGALAGALMLAAVVIVVVLAIG